MEKFYIKQKVFKITDHYPILDEYGNTRYFVDQDFKFIGNTVHVSYPNGQEAFTVEKVVPHIPARFRVIYPNGAEIFLQSRFSLFKRKIDVIADYLDLSFQGDYLDYNFELKEGDYILAEMNRAFFSWGDSFEITVYDPSKTDIAISLIIAADYLIDQQRN